MLRHAVASNSHVFLGRSLSSRSPNVSSFAEMSRDVIVLSDGEVELSLPTFKPGEADTILDQYQRKYAPNQARHIVASTQGEPSSQLSSITHPSRQQLYSESNIKPRSNANFRVKNLTLDEVILILIHPNSNFFCIRSMRVIACLDTDYKRLLSDAPWLQMIDFSSLREPRLIMPSSYRSLPNELKCCRLVFYSTKEMLDF